MDKRTRGGIEADVIDQVINHGGFSVFWATESQKRAHAIERLQDSGVIVRNGGNFPWCVYEVKKPPL